MPVEFWIAFGVIVFILYKLGNMLERVLTRLLKIDERLNKIVPDDED